jgi:hypothetical protein
MIMARVLAIVFGIATLALVVTVSFLISPTKQQVGRSDETITFPDKVFVGTKEFVAAKGTMTADWVAYKNNTYSILCVPDQCIVADVEQIGRDQIGSIDGPTTYPIKRWTDVGEVVAEDESLCSRITITLDRRTESVLWVETPINQTTLACKNADPNIRKATLEASLYWRKPNPPPTR